MCFAREGEHRPLDEVVRFLLNNYKSAGSLVLFQYACSSDSSPLLRPHTGSLHSRKWYRFPTCFESAEVKQWATWVPPLLNLVHKGGQVTQRNREQHALLKIKQLGENEKGWLESQKGVYSSVMDLFSSSLLYRQHGRARPQLLLMPCWYWLFSISVNPVNLHKYRGKVQTVFNRSILLPNNNFYIILSYF